MSTYEINYKDPEENEEADEGHYIPTLDEIMSTPNIAEIIADEELLEIGQKLVEGYEDDELSRKEWLIKYKKGMEIALQVPKDRTWPWPKASNVKFPLMTIACLQFHARAYPALVPEDGVVAIKTVGADPLGLKGIQAMRVEHHMNYQIQEQMEDWNEDMDRLLITLPVTGTEFKKTYYDSELGRPVSEHVFAKDLVVNYFAKDINRAQRVTHIIEMTDNEIEEKERAGLFCEQEYGLNAQSRDDETTRVINSSQGLRAPTSDESVPRTMLEIHTYWDMDGDGYDEPYIVTVDKETRKVARIVARFQSKNVKKRNGKIIKIIPDQYFTRYTFIPSPDGGFYGLGFIHIVGSLNKSVDTIINQLIDAGTLSNLQSGFLSRSFRSRGGNMQFQPGEWKVVNATGQDLAQGIFPLPVREPSGVLFSLLGMLIEVGQRVTSTTDIMVGENPGQNQKATTTQAVVDSGQKVFTAVYKRIRRSLGKEFLRLFELNGQHFNKKEYAEVLGIAEVTSPEDHDLSEDYKKSANLRILPTADPSASTNMQKQQKAQALLSLLPYGLPRGVVMKRVLLAMEIENIDEFQLDQLDSQQPQPDPKLILGQGKLQLDAAKFQHDAGIADREQLRKEAETEIKAEKIGMDHHAAMSADANKTALGVVANKIAANKANNT